MIGMKFPFLETRVTKILRFSEIFRGAKFPFLEICVTSRDSDANGIKWDGIWDLGWDMGCGIWDGCL
jgi:hypothetical protein